MKISGPNTWVIAIVCAAGLWSCGGEAETAEEAASASGTGALACASAPRLTLGETNIARAYFGLLGRAPELSGLSYWRQQLGASPSVTVASNAILAALEAHHAMPATYDDTRYVEALYVHMLGKNADDDPAGVAYWASQLSHVTRGQLLEAIQNAALVSVDSALIQNRFTALECSVRLAKLYNTSLRFEDTFTVLRPVTSDAATANAAIDRAYDLTRPGAPPTTHHHARSRHHPGRASCQQRAQDLRRRKCQALPSTGLVEPRRRSALGLCGHADQLPNSLQLARHRHGPRRRLAGGRA